MGLKGFTDSVPVALRRTDSRTTEEMHCKHRIYWERQKQAKRKRDRLEMMLEMKRLKEL